MPPVPDFVARYDPRAEDERRLDDAISRRNVTWAHYQAASDLLHGAYSRYAGAELAPYIRNFNDAQHDWEWAVRDLTRARVFYGRASRPAPQAAVPAVLEGRTGPPDGRWKQADDGRPTVTVEENEGYNVTVDDDA